MDEFNDDFCDCRNAKSDEPGTSACSFGTFLCEKSQHPTDAHFVPAMFVNDGVCDCCDGSDEYNTPWKCKDLCEDLAL